MLSIFSTDILLPSTLWLTERCQKTTVTLRTIRNCPITVLFSMYEVRDVAHSDKLIMLLALTPLFDPLSFSVRLSGLKWRRLIDRQTDKAMPPAWINNVLNIFMSNCLYRLTALIWNIALRDGNCKLGHTYTNTFTDRVRQLTMIRRVILFYGNSKGKWCVLFVWRLKTKSYLLHNVREHPDTKPATVGYPGWCHAFLGPRLCKLDTHKGRSRRSLWGLSGFI